MVRGTDLEVFQRPAVCLSNLGELPLIRVEVPVTGLGSQQLPTLLRNSHAEEETIEKELRQISCLHFQVDPHLVGMHRRRTALF